MPRVAAGCLAVSATASWQRRFDSNEDPCASKAPALPVAPRRYWRRVRESNPRWVCPRPRASNAPRYHSGNPPMERAAGLEPAPPAWRARMPPTTPCPRWWTAGASNPLPPLYECGALPGELHRRADSLHGSGGGIRTRMDPGFRPGASPPVLSRPPMPFGHTAMVCRDGFEPPRHSGPALQAGAFGHSATCTLEPPEGFPPSTTRGRSPALSVLSYGGVVLVRGFEPRLVRLSTWCLCQVGLGQHWYRRSDSNAHCCGPGPHASCQLGYSGMWHSLGDSNPAPAASRTAALPLS